MLIISVNVFSQKTINIENEIKQLVLNDTIRKAINNSYNQDILKRAGDDLRKSAYYEYGALGSLVASIGLMWIAFNNIDFWNGDSANATTAAFSAISATLLFTSAIVCTIISIKYDKKAGKELKLLINGGKGSIAFTF